MARDLTKAWGANQRAIIRYRFDTAFSSGTGTIIGLLGLATAVLVVGAGALIALTRISVNGISDRPAVEDVWFSLVRTLDPGTMGADTGWGFRVIALGVTIGGIFIVSTLIGLLASGIERSLQRLGKGRSEVLETGHTVILGWSTRVPTIIEELVIANSNQRKPCIAILSPHDKSEIEDVIRTRVRDLRGTRLVVRTGDPSDLKDLEIVRPFAARSVVVMSPDDDMGDATVIRTILALLNKNLGSAMTPTVAEFKELENASAIVAISGGTVIPVVPTQVIARIAAQVCRSRGVREVYEELLDFKGHEFYFEPVAPSLAGLPLHALMGAYEHACVIGFRLPDGSLQLAGDLSATVPTGSLVLAIAEDDDQVVAGEVLSGSASELVAVEEGNRIRESIVILGWNTIAATVLNQLDQSFLSGSTAHVVLAPGGEVECIELNLVNIELTFEIAQFNELAALQEILDRRPDYLLLLCEHAGRTPSEADALVLMCMLRIRHLLQGSEWRPNIISELRDLRDVQLAGVTEADDLIVSDYLACLVMAQLAESPELFDVFEELFSSSGPQIALLPIGDLGDVADIHSFGDLVRLGALSGRVVIGIREHTEHGSGPKVIINPSKSTPLNIGVNDSVVTLFSGSQFQAAESPVPR